LKIKLHIFTAIQLKHKYNPNEGICLSHKTDSNFKVKSPDNITHTFTQSRTQHTKVTHN